MFACLQIASHLYQPGEHIHHIDIPILVGRIIFKPLDDRLLLPVVAGRKAFQGI